MKFNICQVLQLWNSSSPLWWEEENNNKCEKKDNIYKDAFKSRMGIGGLKTHRKPCSAEMMGKEITLWRIWERTEGENNDKREHSLGCMPSSRGIVVGQWQGITDWQPAKPPAPRPENTETAPNSSPSSGTTKKTQGSWTQWRSLPTGYTECDRSENIP